ncbi:DUF1620 domain-containing protein [Podospora aff. communis PSN243]|uniref:DUF1620 domain-containing protein n=1 Tax=Podospora aff. communis PSN243 TaxID=3040156 RepID=A0AAV9H6V3_9PEZI|nr:DUF1620 domain-containing protein [Podospora aff. communis PSN243]
MARSFLRGVALSAAAVRALVHPEPRATDTIAIPLDAQSPAPTTPPALHKFLKRQSGNGQTVLVAPDNTCGYVSAQSGAAYTCVDKTALCVFITASGSGAAGCCGVADCGFRVACLDYDQISSSSLCDAECSTDTFTEKCTNPAARFCGTVVFPNRATDYFCNSLSISTAMSADTTYSGQTGRSLVQTVLTDEISTTLRPLTTVTATATVTPPSQPSSSSTPVGAIVGGVVGGLAVIALVVLGIFLMRRRSKTKFSPVPMQPPASETTQHPFSPGFGPGAGKPGHASVMSAYSAAPPYGTPTPPPGSGYPGFTPSSGPGYPSSAYSQASSPGFPPQQGYGQPGMPVVYEAAGQPVQRPALAEMEAPRRGSLPELQ